MSRNWWARLWGSIAVLGALSSPLVLGAAPAVTSMVVGWAAGLVASATVAPSLVKVDWTRCLGYAGICGSALAALLAATQVLGPSALWVVIVAVATCPWAVRRARTWCWGRDRMFLGEAATEDTRTVHDSRDQPQYLGLVCPIHLFLPTDATAEATRCMETAHLCHAWRRSFLGFEVARSGAELEEVARVRQVLLDELLHRHPDEVGEWMSAGGRAPSGPERFLGRAPHHGSRD